MQSQGSTAVKRPLSKIAKLIPPAGADAAATAAKAQKAVTRAIPKVASLYRGVIGAASGAGIAIGTYFAFYGAASNMLSTSTALAPGQIAFVAGGVAAAGGSVVKVPLAVCIRSVQAGVYPNVFKAAGAITEAAGVRGLFTGYLPTLLEDVPDMAFKFAAYETLRQVHRRLNDGRKANVQVNKLELSDLLTCTLPPDFWPRQLHRLFSQSGNIADQSFLGAACAKYLCSRWLSSESKCILD